MVSIEVPPLRERRVDIMELAIHFVQKYARKYAKPIHKIDEEVLERLKHYPWPGNVRERENVVERAVVLSHGETLGMEDIPMELQILEPARPGALLHGGGSGSAGTSHADLIGEIERKRLMEAMETAGGNKSEAARLLGLKRSTFFNKLKKYGLVG